MIEIKNIDFFFKGSSLFTNFSVDIPDDSLVSIVGESGKGKTTLLNILAGFEIIKSGEIIFDGIKLSKENIFSIRQKIAWLPQNFNVSADSVMELFKAPFNLKVNKKLFPQNCEIEELLNSLHLEKSILEKNIDEISGGQKQRILIASILATKKNILLLDEPTSALDKKTSELVVNVLKKEKRTVIISTHDKTIQKASDIVIDLNTFN